MLRHTKALASTALFIGASACIELPPPLELEVIVSDDDDGAGGAASQAGGAGGAGGGGGDAGGAGGAMAPPLPICQPGTGDTECAEITQLVSGDYHNCLIASDGYTWCWGSNLNGELGDPSLDNVSHVSPRVVAGFRDAERISLGASFSCALRERSVFCWGVNDRGQLGLSDTAPRDTPTLVPLSDVKLVATSRRNAACAVTYENRVFCWGRLINGQNWNEDAFTATPTEVEGLEGMNIRELGLSNAHACVVSEDGFEARCWGRNETGLLGDGTNTSSVAAVTVSSTLAVPVRRFHVGGGATCVLGGLPQRHQCWGWTGTGYANVPTLVEFSIASLVLDISQGWSHMCVHGEDSWVYCLGESHYGELGPSGGDGAAITSPVPVLSGVLSMSPGWQHNCAVMLNGEVRCWGRNQFGQSDPTQITTEVKESARIAFDTR